MAKATTKFNKGDRIFDINGNEFEYYGVLEGNCIAFKVIQFTNIDEYYGEYPSEELSKELYILNFNDVELHNVITQKKSKELIKIKKEYDKISDQIISLRSQKTNLELDILKCKSNIKKLLGNLK